MVDRLVQQALEQLVERELYGARVLNDGEVWEDGRRHTPGIRLAALLVEVAQALALHGGRAAARAVMFPVLTFLWA